MRLNTQTESSTVTIANSATSMRPQLLYSFLECFNPSNKSLV
jgi:hypothetical protein